MKAANASCKRKFRWRGGFYGTELPWRNAESEGGEAAVGKWCVFALALVAEAATAAIVCSVAGGAPEAAGGEAGAGWEC